LSGGRGRRAAIPTRMATTRPSPETAPAVAEHGVHRKTAP
jgi:hypothetical protein